MVTSDKTVLDILLKWDLSVAVSTVEATRTPPVQLVLPL